MKVRVSMFLAAIAVVSIPTFAGLSGCSSTSSGGDQPFSVSATNADLFAKVWQPTCANDVTCHVSNVGDQKGSYLDLSGGANHEPSVACMNLRSVKSTEAPGLTLVTPNDPANSYLLKKITQGAMTNEPDDSGLDCSDPKMPDVTMKMNAKTSFPCGDLMPQNVSGWADRAAVITAVTAWINAGASCD
jgi:hypothetical protein